jgi:hypothetical protein
VQRKQPRAYGQQRLRRVFIVFDGFKVDYSPVIIDKFSMPVFNQQDIAKISIIIRL